MKKSPWKKSEKEDMGCVSLLMSFHASEYAALIIHYMAVSEQEDQVQM